MANNKDNIVDSINSVNEEEALKKVDSQESLQDPGVREEHFKQNILMDVAEFPEDESSQSQDESQHQLKPSEEIDNEKAQSPSDKNVISHDAAIEVDPESYESNQTIDENYQLQSNLDTVDSENIPENLSNSIQAEINEPPLGETEFSAFQELSIDQELEEAVKFASEAMTEAKNSAPIASDSNATTNEDNIFSGKLIATDNDSEDTLSYNLLTQPTEGYVTVNSDGSYIFSPGDEFQDLADGESRAVTFNYQVEDLAGATDTAEMTIIVTGTNDGPIASATPQYLDEDNILYGQLTAVDIDSDDLIFSLLSNTDQGDITINSDGSFAFVPGNEFQDLASGEMRNVTFSYQVQDEAGAIDTQEVTITVQGNNDAPLGMYLTNTDVDENISGAIIGELSVTDIDINDTHNFVVNDPRFEVVFNSSGVPVLKLLDDQSIDYEMENSIDITITVTDSSGESYVQNYNVSINNDTNEFDVSAVTDSDSATNEVSESASVGATVGVTAFAEDQDGTNSDVTYSLSSNPGNAFAIDADTGVVTVNDPSALDFETSQTMQIEVTATSEDGSTSSQTFNIAINDADEFDVSAVTDTDRTTNEVSESAARGKSVGITAFAEDQDASNSDVTYSLSSNPGNAFAIDAITGEVIVADQSQLDFETSQTMQIEVTATSEDGSTSSQTFNIAINDADEFSVSAVTDTDRITNEVSESAARGTSVGVTAFAEDQDGSNSDVTYSLSGNPSNSFAIDAITGEVIVADPSQLDFETAQTMQIEVTATSEDGSTSTQTFDISINDADEFDVSAVTDSDSATNEVSESAARGTSVGITAFAEDRDGTNSDVTYSLSSNPGNAFAIDATSGEVIVADPSQLDFETSQTMQIEVTATSEDGSTSTQTFDIAINDADEFDVTAVIDTDRTTNEVSESAARGTSVGVTAFAEDQDGTNSDVSYSLSSNPGNAFAIDAITGEVIVADPSQLDFETSQTMQIEVTATSEDGSTSSQTFNIAINDADEFDVSVVTDTDAATNEVSESAARGTSVGVTAFAEDQDGTNSDVTYSLSSNPGNAFAIDAITGEVTVSDPSALDFETAQTMQIEVTATSEDGSTSTQTFDIAINDADEFDVSAVTDTDAATNEVSESAARGTTVGITAFAEDQDGTNSDVSYSLSSNPGNAFAIDAITGEVIVADPSQLDFETSQTMQIEVTATSEDGSSLSETFNIAINDADEFDVSAVTDSDSATNEVSESASVGATVGVTAFAEDQDGTNSDVTYSLSSNPGNAFAIDAKTGEVTVNDPSALDFETAQTMQIEVTATSEDGSSLSETFNIAINDADEFDVSAVTDSDSATNEVSESAARGTTVGITAFAEDQDGTNSDVSYSLSSNPGNAFAIDATTGEVTVNDPSALDFETAQTMQIEVTATSEDGSTSTQTFNIAINDADEFDVSAVTDTDAAINEVSESAARGTSVGVTAFAEDQDGTNSDVTYSLSSNPGNAFAIDAITGEVTVSDPSALDFETAQTMQIEVTATSEDGSVSSETFTINITDVNEDPVITKIEVSDTSTSLDQYDVVVSADGTTGTMGNNVNVSVFQPGGDASQIVISSDGIGVDSTNVTNDIANQIDYDPTSGESEQLVLDFVNPVMNLQLTTGKQYPNEGDVGEQGIWTAYDVHGNIVASGELDPDLGVNVGANSYQYELNSDLPISKVVIEANDYTDSDFSLVSVQFNETSEIPLNDNEEIIYTIAENTSSGSPVADVNAFDVDGDSLTYSITQGNADGAFTIDSSTGVISVADSNAIDHESADSRTLTVTVDDGNGGTDTADITINITDVNEAPTDIKFSGNENLEITSSESSGTAVVTGNIQSIGSGASVDHWAITHEGGNLAIDVFADGFQGGTLDSQIILYRDNGDGTYTNIVANDDGPIGTDGSSSSLDSYLSQSNLASGDYIIAISGYPLSDSDARATSDYPNSDGDTGPYQITISGDTVVNGIATNPSVGGDWGNPQGNAVIVDNGDASSYITAGSVVASVASVVDQDGGDSHTFTLTDDASGKFEIDTNTGQISLVNQHDASNVYSGSVSVQVTDSKGETYIETVGIHLGTDTTQGTTGNINSSNYTQTGNGYTVSAKNVVGGVHTDASIDNISNTSNALGVDGTVSDTDSGQSDQLAYDKASGLSEEFIVDFDNDLSSADVSFMNLYTSSYGEVGHWAAYHNGELVAEGDFTETSGGSGTINIEPGETFNQIVMSAKLQTDGTDGSDYQISGISYTEVPVGDEITGTSNDDIIYGFAGDDVLSGGNGNDIFIFDQGDGNDIVDGGSGAGWVDTIDLSGYVDEAIDPSSPWQIEVDGALVDYDINDGLLELGEDVSGVIQFDDGSQLTFDNVENIEW